MDDEVCPPPGNHPAIAGSKLRDLTARSDRKGTLQLAGHLVLLGAGSTLIIWAESLWWLLPALLGQAVAVIFLFAPLHECIHRTAFRSRRVNDAVARFCGLVLLLPAGYFRAFHFQHHRFTQDPSQDPELATPGPSSRAGYLVKVSGLPYWRERCATLWRHAGGRITEPFVAAQQRPAIRREAQAHLALYALLAAVSLGSGTALLVWLWVLPALIGQPFLRLFLMAEHSGCPQVPDMLANSRTTLTNRAMEALCWQMNRHSAHHAYPAIPFHALPAADRLLAPRIIPRASGYIALHREIWASLPAT